MNKEVMRSYLLRDKAFLRQLYEGTNPVANNRILTVSSDSKLNTLIRYLHFVSNGEIKIKRQNFDKIPSNKLNLIRRNVEKKAALARLIRGEREAKIKFLKKLSSVYGALLYVLFNEG